MIYGVILAGGKGERFWPLSRQDKPKQFLKLISDKTMLEETILRVKPLIPLDRVRIVAGESMSEHIKSAVDYLDEGHILTEPTGRNTCLAIGLAAVHLFHEDREATMVVLSSDHLIRPPEKLLKVIKDACGVAKSESALITIGIGPTRPETAYGYIKVGEEFETEYESPIFKVAGFTEKPKAALAQEYYYSRKYLWNSGMFVWTAKAILGAITACDPQTGALLEEYSKKIGTAQQAEARSALYQEANSISIDYAVLEKATNVMAVKADLVWDDVGSWLALERYKEVDSDNNVVIGDSVMLETYETTIYNEGKGIIATLGVNDLVIVRSGDITLVAHKAKLGEIKKLLAKIESDEKTRSYL